MSIVGLTVALSACGQEDGSRVPVADPRSAAAESVSVVQTGGIAGGSATTTVVAGSPAADEVLALAGRLAGDGGQDGGEDSGEPHQSQCCDLMAYTITIETADGSTVRLRTSDTERSPAHDLVLAVLALDAPTTGSPTTDPR